MSTESRLPAEAPEPIEGSRLRLRPVEERDLSSMLRWLVEPQVLYWWDEELTDLDAARREYLEPDPVSPGQGYVIEEGERGVGYIQWWQRTRDEEDSWWAGIDIFIGEPEARERGLGTEAVRMLLAYLLEVRRLHRVTIDPETANTRAIRSYEKAGFRRDGVLRHNDFLRGVYVDTQMMSILEDEWPAERARWGAERTAESRA